MMWRKTWNSRSGGQSEIVECAGSTVISSESTISTIPLPWSICLYKWTELIDWMGRICVRPSIVIYAAAVWLFVVGCAHDRLFFSHIRRHYAMKYDRRAHNVLFAWRQMDSVSFARLLTWGPYLPWSDSVASFEWVFFALLGFHVLWVVYCCARTSHLKLESTWFSISFGSQSDQPTHVKLCATHTHTQAAIHFKYYFSISSELEKIISSVVFCLFLSNTNIYKTDRSELHEICCTMCTLLPYEKERDPIIQFISSDIACVYVC